MEERVEGFFLNLSDPSPKIKDFANEKTQALLSVSVKQYHHTCCFPVSSLGDTKPKAQKLSDQGTESLRKYIVTSVVKKEIGA